SERTKRAAEFMHLIVIRAERQIFYLKDFGGDEESKEEVFWEHNEDNMSVKDDMTKKGSVVVENIEMIRGATWAGFNPNPARRTRTDRYPLCPSSSVALAQRRCSHGPHFISGAAALPPSLSFLAPLPPPTSLSFPAPLPPPPLPFIFGTAAPPPPSLSFSASGSSSKSVKSRPLDRSKPHSSAVLQCLEQESLLSLFFI
ncbi:hypothetical protein ACLOJK_034472, partial [Asimina triloba]